jgi:hypothetical protein
MLDLSPLNKKQVNGHVLEKKTHTKQDEIFLSLPL